MSDRPWGPESFLPWVEGVAGHIDDPVVRLRFLRVATPCARPGSPARRRRRAFRLLSELALVLFLILAFAMGWMQFGKLPAGLGTARGKAPHHPSSALRL